MAGTFIVGETKIRPGTYFNIQKVGENQIVGASDGVVAIFFKSDFGPLAQAVEITPEEGYEKLYGTAGSTNAIREVIRAGATKCVCVRVGKGGTAATVTLDKDGDTEALKITAKYPGAKDFAITVREKLSDSSLKECIIYSGAKEFEKLEFAAGDDEVKALNDAFVNSKCFTAEIMASATGVLADVSEEAFTPGTDPIQNTAKHLWRQNHIVSMWHVLIRKKPLYISCSLRLLIEFLMLDSLQWLLLLRRRRSLSQIVWRMQLRLTARRCIM